MAVNSTFPDDSPDSPVATTDPTARVLILAPRLDTIGGVENYYNALQLHLFDNRVEYFAVTGSGRESFLQLSFRLARNYWHFWKQIRSERFQLIILNPTLDPRSYYRDAVFCWLAQQAKLRILVFFRGWAPTFEAKIRTRIVPRSVFRRTFARVKNFVVLGRIFKQRLLEMGCGADSRFWIETTVADSRFLGRFSLQSRMQSVDVLQLLFLARLTRAKGPSQALQAFYIAQQRRPDLNIQLVIAGPGPELSFLQTSIAEYSIRNVTLTGPVRDAEKADLLMSSHVLLHPTASDEGMPNAILEAMLYGMPILTTAVGAIPEVVTHGKNGFVADAPDPDLFADWIIRLATDLELRSSMARTNHEQASRLYTDSHVRARMVAIIDACLAVNDIGAAKHPS